MSPRETRVSSALQASLAWPCLARAFEAGARGSAEVTLIADIALTGDAERLVGTIVLRLDSPEPSGERGRDRRMPLLGAPLHAEGSLKLLGHWHALTIRAEGGVQLECLVRTDLPDEEGAPVPMNASDVDGEPSSSAYICTNLHHLLGLDGGRYGAPTVRWHEVLTPHLAPV